MIPSNYVLSKSRATRPSLVQAASKAGFPHTLAFEFKRNFEMFNACYLKGIERRTCSNDVLLFWALKEAKRGLERAGTTSKEVKRGLERPGTTSKEAKRCLERAGTSSELMV
ncbi:hypothetical protein AMTRI_Chr02g215990 [Amborella trichopoda]